MQKVKNFLSAAVKYCWQIIQVIPTLFRSLIGSKNKFGILPYLFVAIIIVLILVKKLVLWGWATFGWWVPIALIVAAIIYLSVMNKGLWKSRFSFPTFKFGSFWKILWEGLKYIGIIILIYFIVTLGWRGIVYAHSQGYGPELEFGKVTLVQNKLYHFHQSPGDPMIEIWPVADNAHVIAVFIRAKKSTDTDPDHITMKLEITKVNGATSAKPIYTDQSDPGGDYQVWIDQTIEVNVTH